MGERSDSPGPLRFRLWAGGLYKDITEDEVRRKMQRFGEVVDVRIRSSQRDTFAFVQFTNGKAIENAIEKMDNSSSLGDRVRVARATENTKKRCDDDNFRREPSRDDSREDPRARRGGSMRDDSRDDSRGPERRDGRGDFRGRRGGYREDYDSGYGRADDRRNGRRAAYREDSRDYRRGGRPRDDDYSPPPRTGGRSHGGHDGHARQRSRSGAGDGVVRMAGKVPVGRHKITVANLPEDMSWLELKDLGRDYGPSLTFARTYRQDNAYFGMLEFKDREDADRVISELNNRRVQGSKVRLRAFYGGGPGS